MNNNSFLNDVLRKVDNDRKAYDEAFDMLFGETFQKSMPHFEVVSFEQFKKDWMTVFEDEYWDTPEDAEEIKDIYNDIKLPSRSSTGSAGYDIFSPVSFYIKPGESIMIPTGIRVYMPQDMVFMIYPRSGLGTKHRFIPCNLTGVVDSDFYYSDNEGHIHMKMANDSDHVVTIDAGKAFCQGVFTKYYTVYGDNVSKKRNGGFGSSGM